MLFTNNEIKALCQITGIDYLPGFEAIEILGDRNSKQGIQGLEEKKIVEDKKLTKQGLAVASSLYKYAKAKKILTIGLGKFALIEDSEYVLLNINQDKNYNMELVNQDQIVAILLSKFKTWNTLQKPDYKKRIIDNQQFFEFIQKNKECEAIYYNIFDKESKKEKKAVFFIADGWFQHYDQKTNHLDCYPANRVQNAIERMFE